MPSFDYISSAEFRALLESDYADMGRCAEVGAWKSVQVLSGSIVEALLVDYLTSTSHPARSTKDPLKMDLAETIAACKAEGVLSDRSADLCSVVRSYRNLIHPGRIVRLDEPPPSKTTCDIATALIDLIVDDISRIRRAAVGLTAEQIISKLMRDSGCLPILKHLLAEVSEPQRERLLVASIPKAYFNQLSTDEPFDETAERLSGAYRITLDSVSQATKENAAREFVRVLKEEDGSRVEQYRKAFFRGGDLAAVTVTNRPLVKGHLLGAVGSIHSLGTIRMLDGIGPFLEAADCLAWVDPFIRTLASTTVKENVKRKCREFFIDTACFTSNSFDAKVLERLDDWIRHYSELANPANSDVVQALRDDVVALSTP